MLALAMLSAAARWMPVELWAWPQVLPAFDLLMFAISACGLLVYALSRWPPALPVITVVFYAALVVARNAPMVESCELKPEEMHHLSILSLNVQQFGNDTARVNAMVQRLLEADADVVCLQEFGLYYKWPDVTSVTVDFAARLHMPYAEFTPHTGNIFGTAIFSRFPILSCDTSFQLLSHNNEAKVYRLQVGADTFHLANAHLQSFNLGNKRQKNEFGPAAVIRMQQTQAEALVDRLSRHSPAMIVGDFNVPAGSCTYVRLQSCFRDVQRCWGQGILPTHQWLPARIDYQFASTDLCVRAFHLDAGYPSDHKALRCEIAW